MADHAVVADEQVDLSRRKFLTRATIATGAVGAAFAAVPFIESWAPSERARAQGAPTELDLSKLDAGQMAIDRMAPLADLCGAPHAGHGGAHLRTRRAISRTRPPKHSDPARLRQEPGPLAQRRVPGADRHLHAPGCLPKQRFSAGELYPSWPGGFFCPCHGSRFDLAGRVFDGSPASINLRVPPYSYPKPTNARDRRRRERESPDGR